MSCEAKLDADELAEVDNESGMPDGLLADGQRRFLADCATGYGGPGKLTRLGPIEATKWKTVAADGLARLEANAERWQVAGLDFLEVSVRVKAEDVDDAGAGDAGLLAALDAPRPARSTPSGTNKTSGS